MVAEVKNQQKLTRANSLKNKKNTKARLDHVASRLVKTYVKIAHLPKIIATPCCV